MSKTNILAETLAEIQELREAVSKNANHALTSTLKGELEEIVKNNLTEGIGDEESTDDMPGGDLPGDLDQADNNGEGMGGDATDLSGEEGEEVIDLTGKPDEEVIKHFELMEPADEIEIVQTPEGGLQININPSSEEEESEEGSEEEELPAEDLAEYGDEHPMATKDAVERLEEEGKVDEYGDEHPIATKDAVNNLEEVNDEMIKEEEPMFEVEISEEDLNEVAKEATAHIVNKGGSVPTGESKLEEPAKENGIVKNAATKHVTTKGGSVPTGEKKLEEPAKVSGVIKNAATKDINENAKAGNTDKEKELHESLVVMRKKYQEVVAENNKKTKELEDFKTLAEEFKGSESDYKSAIKNLKSQLQEVALFSSNLTYAIKLITENSTTKDEKLDILKRFDSAKNLNESREIFNTMQTQFSSNKTATKQMVEEKIMETPKASGSSKLNESTAYTNPQLDRIREIIGKI
ncbi:MAG: hypothetical protein RLZ10_797 [Bacteroidota bacterium]|jgi:hypothetical protein